MRWTGVPQHRAGLAVAAVYGHPLAEGRDLLGERVAGFGDEPARPRASTAGAASHSRAISSSPSRLVSCSGDSRAACRISSEYALPMPLEERGSVSARLSVWFSLVSARAKRREVGGEDLEPAGIDSASASASPTTCSDARRLRARLRQEQRARREVEGREAEPRGNLRAALLPLKPSRDHQVEDEIEIALEVPDDALAEPAQRDDRPAVALSCGGVTDRMRNGLAMRMPLERLADEARAAARGDRDRCPAAQASGVARCSVRRVGCDSLERPRYRIVIFQCVAGFGAGGRWVGVLGEGNLSVTGWDNCTLTSVFDTAPILWLQSFSTPWLTTSMNVVSLLGYSHCCLAVAALVAFGWKLRPGVALFVIVALTAVLVSLAKSAWAAPRPMPSFRAFST